MCPDALTPDQEVENAALYNAFIANQGKLRAFLVNFLGNVHDGEDVLQDLFVKLSVITAPERIENPVAFLFVVATNMARDHQRKHVRSRRITEGDYKYLKQIAGDGLPTGESAIWSKQWIETFKSALKKMPQRQRQVFILHRIENLTQSATAAQLGISIKMVEKHMARAIKHCRRSLSDFLTK